MLDDYGDRDFPPPSSNPEHLTPPREFKTFVAKRAELLESIGLVIFDPKQLQWRSDVARQISEISKLFRQALSQIYDSSKSASDFALETAEFMAEDRAKRVDYIGRIVQEPQPVTLPKTELNDIITHLYLNVMSPPILFSDIEMLFQNSLQADINWAMRDIVNPSS